MQLLLKRAFLVFSMVLLVVSCGSESNPATVSPAGVQTIGSIEGSINGETMKWFLTSGEQNGDYISQSEWTTMFANHADITLYGHAEEGTLFGTKGALLLNITVMDLDQAAQVSSQEVVYLAGGMREAYTSDAQGGSAQIVIENISITADKLTVAGTVQAEMPYSRAFNKSTEAPEVTTVSLQNGRFEATVTKTGPGR